MRLEFTVSGKPRGKQRPRFWNGRAVTPQETRDYERLIALKAKLAGARPVPNPCVLILTARFQIPASWPNKRKRNPPEHTSRSDLDNIIKVASDALNGVAFVDDAQIYEITARKEYSETEGLDVIVAYD